MREVVIETKAHSEIPYDRLCEELHRSGTPPPEMSAMFQIGGRWPRLESDGIDFGPPRYTTRGMPWGFIFLIDPYRERERWVAKFDARIYDPEEVRGFLERYRGLVTGVLRKPRRRLGRQRP